ncbi:MAG: hypothetical protein AAGC70_20695, partial [Pseudomonadota bacterium]
MRFSLRQREANGHASEVPSTSEPAAGLPISAQSEVTAFHPQRQELMEAKLRLHRQLIDELNLAQVDKMSRSELRPQVFGLVEQYVLSERIPLNSRELGVF